MSELAAIKSLLEQHIKNSMDQYAELKATLDVQNRRLVRTNQSLVKMNFVLLGDSESKTDGLVHKVDKHHAYISKDKRFKWTVAGILVGGTGGGWAALWAYLKAKLGGF